MSLQNPFICYGSDGLSTLCGRPEETARLLSLIGEDKNVVVRSPRRTGKTTFFRQVAEEFRKKGELCVIADIYPARSVSDFVAILANAFLEGTRCCKDSECRYDFLKSVGASFCLDVQDTAAGLTRERLSLRIGVPAEEAMSVLLSFIEGYPGTPVLFIDDFQQTFLFDTLAFVKETMRRMYASTRYVKVLGESNGLPEVLFIDNGLPFEVMELAPLTPKAYFDYARQLFLDNGRTLPGNVFINLYDMMSGVTSFIQRVLAVMYDITRPGRMCSEETLACAIDRVLDENAYIYEDFIRELPERQKDLLVIIARGHHVTGMASAEFCFANGITASSVQSARRALLEKQLISEDDKGTFIKDEFFRLWINRTF